MVKRCVFVLMILLAVSSTQIFSSGKTDEGKPVELTALFHPVLYSASGGENGLIKEFAAKSGVKVNVVTAPLDQILEKTLLDFVSKAGSYDVFTYSDSNMHRGLANYLLPLDKYVAEADKKDNFQSQDILKSMMDYCRFDGGLYGIPYRYGVYMLYYRTDLFSKYNVAVPETWDDFFNACKKITDGLRKDGINDVYAIVQPLAENQYFYENYKAWLAGYGGAITDPKGNFVINSPQAIEALKAMMTPVRNGWVRPDAAASGLDAGIADFQNGKAAMYPSYSPYWGLFTDPTKSKIAGSVGFALLPHAKNVKYGRSSFSGWQLLINKDSKNRNAAWKLVEHLSTQESVRIMALNYANGPVRKSVLSDPDYVKKIPAAAGWLKSYEACEPLMPGGHEKSGQFIDIIGREVASAFLGNKAPEQALNDARANLEKLK